MTIQGLSMAVAQGRGLAVVLRKLGGGVASGLRSGGIVSNVDKDGVAAAATFAGRRYVSVEALKQSDRFEPRHNSLRDEEAETMAKTCGFPSVEALIDATVPDSIRRKTPMKLMDKYNAGLGESEFIESFKKMAEKNVVNKSFIGMGYYGTHLPPVIQRNLLENPGWYTQYTPYQAEISQGRLESLLNFQTMVTDLTGLEFANSSLLDESTAAAEAMTLCSAVNRGTKPIFLVDERCHPQTIAVCDSRAKGLGLEVVVCKWQDFESHYASKKVCGVLVQYPNTDGAIIDYEDMAKTAKAAKVMVVAATDLLALTQLTPPAEWGADVCVGSAQRLGVPMGYGGPHAGFFATFEKHKRMVPGRIIGISVDSAGNPALRMAMQTREQHIRRDKATSNICTAQALLANIAGMYGVYHGPEGLKTISHRIHSLSSILAEGAMRLGYGVPTEPFFDTVTLKTAAGGADKVLETAVAHGCNFRKIDDSTISIAFDETTKPKDVDLIFSILSGGQSAPFTAESLADSVSGQIPEKFARKTPFMTQTVFNSMHAEHDMLRYLKKLESRDLSLCHSMIALGSCTMKLNSTTQMMPVTWPELANMHPYAPVDQAEGYNEMFKDLSDMLCEITGFDSMSLQPNSGASGEYAGLMSIRQYHMSRGDSHRNICIIPTSAHGTNPASAVMAGMKIVTTGVDSKGFVSIDEVRAAAEKHKDNLAAFMITYPSTHGVYEDGIEELCKIIHDNGGQVYMDGANMNAQVGLTSPGMIGADVCHLNLHKTFCIPHGGGGPGMGPIGVKKHLAPFLPSHPVIPTGGFPRPEGECDPFGTMAGAPYGSSLILPISFAYIAMMGADGLTKASKHAILSANYMAKKLEGHYPILFKGNNGTCAHEFILDLRPFKNTAGLESEDFAKRLIDYGFHSPTMSWPVAGTLMIEPTESENKAELDRFCDAMIAIRHEVAEIEKGLVDKENNVLKNAPHTAAVVMQSKWDHEYSREKAAFPAPWTREAKFWPTTSRVDNVYGDRVLITKIQPEIEELDEFYSST